MIILAILSFIFDGVISLLISKNSLFLSLFSIMSLLVIFPYIKNKINLVYIAILLGFLYDIVYTQTPFLNTIIFLVISLIILLFYKYVPLNFISTCVLLIIIIIIFRTLSYILFILVNDYLFDFNSLLTSIYSSIILNVLYVFTFNIILKIFYKKKKVY